MPEISTVVGEFMRRCGKENSFLEHEVKHLLKETGLPVPPGLFFSHGKVPRVGKSLRYPLVAKVASSKIASKSDVGGVKRPVENEDELKKAVQALLDIEGAEGVYVEEMAPQGLEVIVGGIIDRQFGPVVMFGLGGVFVEVFRDVTFGLAPLTEEEALRLISRVRGRQLLDGFRGGPPVDVIRLAGIIVVVSELMASGLIEEIDLNPVALYPDGALILDAKMKGVA